ncbi:hypothetical protein ACFC1T_09595 [Kitasatospora sp. NPDC056076]|uniref:hypothetical protein n=1 Tax=Kitasatospora sp. NPDC056076 TaxID=3345703 RepID=UPI0035D6F5C5
MDWPADPSCWTPQHQVAAEQASDILRALTGGRFGLCHRYVRPCRRACAGAYAGPYGSPYGYNGIGPYGTGSVVSPLNLGGGEWVNMVCGNGCATDCGCSPLCEVELPSPVAQILEVKIDGKVVVPSSYRVDDNRFLVRTEGECWPWCQEMAKADTEVGTFSVRYLIGRAIPPLGVTAHSVLANELFKKCSGQKCRLPGPVQQITREGITYDMLDPRGWLDMGLTGVDEVDRWLKIVNPRALRTAPGVWSPDFPHTRSRRMLWPPYPSSR